MTTTPWSDAAARVMRAEQLAQQRSIAEIADSAELDRTDLWRKVSAARQFRLDDFARASRALGLTPSQMLARVERELALALADGAHTLPALRTQSTNPVAAVAADDHTEVE
ncbi:hypothetical protein QU668_04030 [Schaalia sp. HMT-877]|nr:hypothetical protein QU668_04030 [Schaalia sp. HMT-877]